MADIETNVIDLKRQYRLGTRLINTLGETYQYAKIDFGSLGKCIVGSDKTYRHIEYRWIRIR